MTIYVDVSPMMLVVSVFVLLFACQVNSNTFKIADYIEQMLEEADDGTE